MSLLQKIKSGKKNYKIIKFPGTDENVAIVLLSSDETTMAKLKADEFNKKNNITDEIYLDKSIQEYIIFYALRDPEDLNKKVAESIDELKQSITVNDLAYLMIEYTNLSNETNPLINSLTEEMFEELKKTLEKTSLKDLNGESLLSLRNFLMSLR